ncbi:Very-long-chain 3-oxoacyl-CoA reductase [Teratosphaeria destructans]|uniref:Very-long-chain 3-oxoacyl-CoA reductase n=1 Tax=Teratosphaeria destructans TaxID=418781 RepID=A0A9W7SMR4_9PEZI|nr:Very-long-chain 3-oxoacyl-CoA reductase [Teratosphaeria destructans]
MEVVTEQLRKAVHNPFFAIVGLLYLSAKLYSLYCALTELFLLPGININKIAKKGTWALITGASDGIGKEYALQLAAKGYNVLLVSRTQSKLDAVGAEVKQKYGVQVKVLAMDFGANRDEDYVKISELARELDIGVLINNVGQSHSIPVPFAQTPEQEMKDIVTINCVGTLRITRLIVPYMVERRSGLVLTMASFGGILPTPLLATYSGSKAFLQQWSSALTSELAPHGVHVQLVQSYLVTSAMSKIKKTSMLIPNPRAFVKAALGKLGKHGGAQGVFGTSTPFWSHGLMHWAIKELTPGPMSGVVIGVNKGMHEDIRRRALRKAEREAKKV